MLKRGASESCLHRASAQAQPISGVANLLSRFPPVAELGQGEGARGSLVSRGEAEHPLGAALKDHEDSESLRKKVVKFKAKSNHNSPRQATEGRDSLLGPFAIDESGAGEVGLRLLANSNKSSRRYSMDDYGVNIAHRAELQTSEVNFLRFTWSSAIVIWRSSIFDVLVFVAKPVVVIPAEPWGVKNSRRCLNGRVC